MKGWAIAGAVLVAAVVLVVARRYHLAHREGAPAALSGRAAVVHEEDHGSFLHGRVATVDGAVYQGRLRWGGDQEAFWGNYFNGAKRVNPWAGYVPPERLRKERNPLRIFGFEIASRERPMEMGRLFMTRFGDIDRIEARGREVRVTLKSGTTIDLDRYEAGDFDDGVRVWDAERGVTDVDSARVGSIELFGPAESGAPPDRMHGTVRTTAGKFTGFVQWDLEQCTGSDELAGRTEAGERRLRFGTIGSMTPHSRDSFLVKLRDGGEVVLTKHGDAGLGHRGLYVDDRRYGRVLISWNVFEKIDFTPAPGGPAYDDYPPGWALRGSVTTRAGLKLTGRLVYDLDESESTDTLDAPSEGVNYTIPFGLIASIALPASEDRVRVKLRSGEELDLERSGDLGNGNAGMLVFQEGRRSPEYVIWSEMARVDLEHPPGR